MRNLNILFAVIFVVFVTCFIACKSETNNIYGNAIDGDVIDGDIFDSDKIDTDIFNGDFDEVDFDKDEIDKVDFDKNDFDKADFDTNDFDSDFEQPENPISKFVDAVNLTAYTNDLTFVAKERVPGSDHWQAVQDMCKARFTDLGYTLEMHNYGSGINVIGKKAGTDPNAGDVIVSAHYDHIPGCTGADDNASGIASVLEIARILATESFKNNLVFACWDEEETGLIGSRAYAERAKENGETIIASLVFDTIAYTDSSPDSQKLPAGFDLIWPEMGEWLLARQYRGDFITIISDLSSRVSSDALKFWAASIDLPLYVIELNDTQKTSALFGDLRRSDHASFWENNFPALQVTDSADFRNPYYHCRGGQDTIESINIPFALEVTKATLGAAMELLELVQE